jgi:hypothetical protein
MMRRKSRHRVPVTCSIDDLINDAVERTLDGRRPWRKERCPLYQHLYGVARSTLWHHIFSYQNINIYSIFDNIIVIDIISPEEIAIATEELVNLLDYLKAVDPKLEILVKKMQFPDADPGEIISFTIPNGSKEIDSLKKKLRRALKAYGEGARKPGTKQSRGC